MVYLTEPSYGLSLYKLKIWRAGGAPFILPRPPRALYVSSHSLLQLPPPNPEWPASFPDSLHHPPPNKAGWFHLSPGSSRQSCGPTEITSKGCHDQSDKINRSVNLTRNSEFIFLFWFTAGMFPLTIFKLIFMFAPDSFLFPWLILQCIYIYIWSWGPEIVSEEEQRKKMSHSLTTKEIQKQCLGSYQPFKNGSWLEIDFSEFSPKPSGLKY